MEARRIKPSTGWVEHAVAAVQDGRRVHRRKEAVEADWPGWRLGQLERHGTTRGAVSPRELQPATRPPALFEREIGLIVRVHGARVASFLLFAQCERDVRPKRQRCQARHRKQTTDTRQILLDARAQPQGDTSTEKVAVAKIRGDADRLQVFVEHRLILGGQREAVAEEIFAGFLHCDHCVDRHRPFGRRGRHGFESHCGGAEGSEAVQTSFSLGRFGLSGGLAGPDRDRAIDQRVVRALRAFDANAADDVQRSFGHA